VDNFRCHAAGAPLQPPRLMRCQGAAAR
jgi:hypothetical protein